MSERSPLISLAGAELSLDVPHRPSRWLVSSETANQLTHGLGFGLSLVAATTMAETVLQSSDLVRTIGCLVYLLTLVALYAASMLSHSFDDPARRSFYRLLDQVCIFLLVAGSYTPFGLLHVSSGAWWLILAAVWLLALLGIALRILRGEGGVTFTFYVLMGWLPVLTLGHVYEFTGLTGLALVLGGGAAYTGGLWFLVNDNRHPYLHAVWHLCTITGSACHFIFLQRFVAEWPLA